MPKLKSLRRFDGYLQIDHRFSPGTDLIPEGRMFEADTQTCCHCQTIVIMNPLRTRPRPPACPHCDHYVCDNPACQQDCRPFKKLIEAANESLLIATSLKETS